jgi:hypothetical protein
MLYFQFLLSKNDCIIVISLFSTNINVIRLHFLFFLLILEKIEQGRNYDLNLEGAENLIEQ